MYPYLKIITANQRVRTVLDIAQFMQQLNIYPLDISTVLRDKEVLRTIGYHRDNDDNIRSYCDNDLNHLKPCYIRDIFFRLIQEYEQERFDGIYETVNTKYYDLHYGTKYYNSRNITFTIWKFHDIISNIRLMNVPPPHLIDRVYIRSVGIDELLAIWNHDTKMYMFPNIQLNLNAIDSIKIIVKSKFSSNTLGYLAFNVLKEHITLMFKAYNLSIEHRRYLCALSYSSRALIDKHNNQITIFNHYGPYILKYKNIYKLKSKNIQQYFS